MSSPRSAHAHYNRGLIQYFRKEYDAAISDFDQALKLDPALKDIFERLLQK